MLHAQNVSYIQICYTHPFVYIRQILSVRHRAKEQLSMAFKHGVIMCFFLEHMLIKWHSGKSQDTPPL